MTTPFPLQTKLEKLEEIERYFQRPDMDLQEALDKHKEALEIAKEILEYLKDAETVIEKLDLSAEA